MDRVGVPKTLTIRNVETDKDLAAVKLRVRLIQMLGGMIEGMVLVAIIMTWVYHFSTDHLLVYLSLFQIPQVATFLMSVIIIPLYYRTWVKPTKRASRQKKTGLRVTMAYLMLQGAVLLLGLASMVWRVIILTNDCTKADCAKPGHSMLEIALVVINSVSVAAAIMGCIFGGLLYDSVSHITGKTVKVVDRTVDGENNLISIDVQPVEGDSAKAAFGRPILAAAPMMPTLTERTPSKFIDVKFSD
jgi:hypothetical protein